MGTFTVDGVRTDIGPGQAFIVQPGDLVHYCASDDFPWQYHWVGFFIDQTKIQEMGLPAISLSFSMETLLQDFLKEHRTLKSDLTRAHFRPHAATGSLYRVLQIICDALEPNRARGAAIATERRATEHPAVNRYVQALYSIVRQTYSLRITIDEIAGRIGISRKHLAEVVRRETGFTPMQILIGHRMKTGHKLLASTNMSIADVARSCGYEDQFLFSRRFKKEYGCSPSEVRKQRSSTYMAWVERNAY